MRTRFDDIAPSATEVLAPYLAPRLCLMPAKVPGEAEGIGTGAFLSASGRTFVVTCDHIARPFLADRKAKLVVGPRTRIRRDRITLVHADPDPEIDVALLEVHEPDPTIQCFVLNDLANIPDFLQHSFEGSDLLVCGMPFANVRTEGTERTVTPLLYLTEPCKKPIPTRNHLYAVYSINQGGQAGGRHVSLPHPGGLSGSLLFVLPSLLKAPKRIWSVQEMKAAAIVVRASLSSGYIEAINIERLRDAVTPLLSTEA